MREDDRWFEREQVVQRSVGVDQRTVILNAVADLRGLVRRQRQRVMIGDQSNLYHGRRIQPTTDSDTGEEASHATQARLPFRHMAGEER